MLTQIIEPPTFQKKNSQLLKFARQCRGEGFLNDVIITAGEEIITANRLVLASSSALFAEICKQYKKLPQAKSLTKGIEESALQIDFKLNGTSVKDIVDFFYNIPLEVNENNAVNLLEASVFLRIDTIQRTCCLFLLKILRPENSVSIFRAGLICEYPELCEKACYCINTHLREVTHLNDFLNLDYDKLILLFHSLDRKMCEEETVYNAFTAWIKSNEENRKKYLHEFFQVFLDLNKLSTDFIKNVILEEELLYHDSNVVNRVITYLNLKIEENLTNKKQSKVVNTGGSETPKKIKDVCNAFGGILISYTDFPKDLLFHCSLMLNDHVYCIGGEPSLFDAGDDDDQLNASKLVHKMNIRCQGSVWEPVASLRQERKQMGATVYQGSIVAAGGYDGIQHLNSVEIYKPVVSNNWMELSSLNQCRSKNAAVSCTDSVYALGGWDGQTCLSSVESLHDLNNSWRYVQSMNIPRRHLAAVSCNGFIYAIGGEYREEFGSFLKPPRMQKLLSVYSKTGFAEADEEPPPRGFRTSVLRSVEMYNPQRNTWTFAPSMKCERACHSACTLNDQIYVVGGDGADGNIITLIERYDPRIGAWTDTAYTADELIHHSVVAV